MPTVQRYPNGASMFIPSPTRPTAPVDVPKRSKITGWSANASARHRKWLQSVDGSQLDGFGYAVTLTVRDDPPSAEAFHADRRAWEKRVKRMGCIRSHWVVEWQKRGTPHLHMAVYFDHELTAAERRAIVFGWCEIAQEFGAQPQSQTFEVISDARGWAKYCAKHSARTASHYQRNGSGPAHWESTGRLWGHSGEWPTSVDGFGIDWEGFHQLRRLARSWRVANAKAEKDPQRRVQRVRQARHMLRRGKRSSAVWGANEWIPGEVLDRMLDWLASEGYRVESVAEDLPNVDQGVGGGPE